MCSAICCRCSRRRRRSPTSRRGGRRSRNWRARNSLAYKKNNDVILPQYAIQRLFEATRGRDTYITTEVGQHQMWAAQFFGFEEPHRWMTSGGLGTMGYGLPAALGVQVAHPDSLVIDIAGDASVQMTMQEMSTAVQYELPIKIFILNNQYMGMVRQWQQLLHGNRLSHSYSEALPDFVKLAEAFGCVGIAGDQARRSRRRDQGDDHGQAAGAVRLPRRGAGKLLPDDPVRQGAQRNAAAGGSHRRSHRHGLRRRQGAGVNGDEMQCLISGNWNTRTSVVGAAMPPTPAHAWPLLSERLGATAIVKHENHTPTGAFKVRGGLVYVDRLKRERPHTAGLISATRAITARASPSRQTAIACR